MSTSLVIFAVAALVLLIGAIILLVVIWRHLADRQPGKTASQPFAVGYEHEAPKGDLVDGCDAPIRNYSKRKLRMEESTNDFHPVFEVDVERPLPHGLQLFCTMSAYGPSKWSGGLVVGIEDLDDTYRVHARDAEQTRRFFDDPELVDALCDLAYCADLILLQASRLTVVFFDEPDPKPRQEALGAMARAWRALENCEGLRSSFPAPER